MLLNLSVLANKKMLPSKFSERWAQVGIQMLQIRWQIPESDATRQERGDEDPLSVWPKREPVVSDDSYLLPRVRIEYATSIIGIPILRSACSKTIKRWWWFDPTANSTLSHTHPLFFFSGHGYWIPPILIVISLPQLGRFHFRENIFDTQFVLCLC